jgi:hypothetical protein
MAKQSRGTIWAKTSAPPSSLDRDTQLYCCRLHDTQNCAAFFKIKMHQSGMQLGDHQFHHNHVIYDPG